MTDFDKKEDYLELMTCQIRCKKARDMIAEEISQHIDDQKESYINEGFDKDTALITALKQMGDPLEVGKQMDKIHKPRLEWKVSLTALILCLVGILVQIHINKSLGAINPVLEMNIKKQIVYLITGLLLMMAGYLVDYSIIGKYPKVIWSLLIIGILIYAPFGNWINGQMAYLNAYSCLFIPVYGGIMFAYRKKGYVGIIKCLLFSIFACVIISEFIVPLSVYLGLIFSNLIMLSAAVKKNWFGASKGKAMAIIWGWIPIAGLIRILSFSQYQVEGIRNKIDTMIRPELYERGYQMNEVRKIIGNSRLFGFDPDISMGFLSGYNNDYILTYIFGRWGIAAGVFIIILFITLIVHMICVSMHQKIH
ncbi:permease prefix domain 1-containing protein [Anaerocolumna sp. MB42-C2]|uniref:permease prefix domain 1-containing protein n=1 Tax=Anaerocolumna sp. MB42-C2 TaxID=3070997 RepID=UPI0027E1EF15|nr:permease prefix domain 1-containing protein [Anaerocolumna sp. MB42-C2]WMJ86286.1 permease prefix domain 1-containing protein [Anaerocolumna sp. MB42-C2]